MQQNKEFLGALLGIFAIYLLWVGFNVFLAQSTKSLTDFNLIVPTIGGIVLGALAYKLLT